MTTASAPGKVILLGEHAVVYGRPAIAVPVFQVTATATIRAAPIGKGCTILARDIDQQLRLAETGDDNPLALIVRLTLAQIGLPADPDWQINLRSDIPIASGLGSGAAVSTALVRAIFRHTGHALEPERISQLVYRSEELHHGTPSGIDNSVVAYAKPIWFVRGQPPLPFVPAHPFTIAIADSGIASPTKETVGDVRRAWQAAPETSEQIFDQIGTIAVEARRCIETGAVARLGPLFNRNQTLLESLGVSSEALARLVDAARRTGALGAKLSGGGRGGNVIALVDAKTALAVEKAFLAAGAKRVIITTVGEVDGRGESPAAGL